MRYFFRQDRKAIINESYKDAERIFYQDTVDETIVRNTINKFVDAKKNNLIKGQKSDIGYWIKQGWDEFVDFVESLDHRISKRKARAISKKDIIKLMEDDEWLIVVPTTPDASAFYSRNTKWCTSRFMDFMNYIYRKWMLIYIINKETDEKWAIRYSPDVLNKEVIYDSRDKLLEWYELPISYEMIKSLIIEKRSKYLELAQKTIDDFILDVKLGKIKDLSRIMMKGVDFSGSDLRGADFDLAQLEDSNFSGSDLSNSNLTHANFTGTNFENCDFIDATILNSTFSKTNIKGADFTNADIRSSVMFRGAEIDEDTIFAGTIYEDYHSHEFDINLN
jgi:hypothetical protein